MSFIVPAPTPATVEDLIQSGPFWPQINPAVIRDQQRIDGTISAVRLYAVLVEAISSTNGELRAWRIAQQDAGYATLAAVPTDDEGIGPVLPEDEEEPAAPESILVHRYRRAVGCLAKALLLERYRDFDSTGAGDKKADALTDPIDDHRRDYRNAITAIQGKPNTTIELI